MQMKRRLFNTLSALSLLLCVAIVVLWVRSYWAEDIVEHCTPQQGSVGYWGVVAASDNGSVAVGNFGSPDPQQPGGWSLAGLRYTRFRAVYGVTVFKPGTTLLGFGCRYVFNSPRVYLRQIILPHWVFVLVIAALPVLWINSHLRRRRRRKQGLCLVCGYDLRASKERCPECGTAIPLDSATRCEGKAI